MMRDGEVFRSLPLDFYHIFGLGDRVARQCGIGLGDYRPQSRRIRLTEIVEMMLSARDVGGFPPPIAVDGRCYMRVAGHSCCGEIEG